MFEKTDELSWISSVLVYNSVLCCPLKTESSEKWQGKLCTYLYRTQYVVCPSKYKASIWKNLIFWHLKPDLLWQERYNAAHNNGNSGLQAPVSQNISDFVSQCTSCISCSCNSQHFFQPLSVLQNKIKLKSSIEYRFLSIPVNSTWDLPRTLNGWLLLAAESNLWEYWKKN